MNVGDAFFTLLWLDRGGREANPVMDYFLDIGTGAFLAQKCVVVGLWLVLLLVHKNFRFARVGIYLSLAVYALLMLVHFGIIAFRIDPPDPHNPEVSKVVLERRLALTQTTALAAPQTEAAEHALAEDNAFSISKRKVDRP